MPRILKEIGLILCSLVILCLFVSCAPHSPVSEEPSKVGYRLEDMIGFVWLAPPGDASLLPYTSGVPAGFKFDAFDTYFTGPANFAGAGTIDFSVGGWSATAVGKISKSSGPKKDSMRWSYLFAGVKPDPFPYPVTFDINYFDGGIFVGHEHFVFTALNTYDTTGTVSGFDMTQYTPKR